MKRLLTSALLLTTCVVAQAPVVGQEDAMRVRRSLHNNRVEVDRLLELRMRHDLGLPIDGADRTFASNTESTPAEMTRMRRELREQDASTASMRQRFERLRKAVAQLRAEAGLSDRVGSGRDPGISVPAVGSSLNDATHRIEQVAEPPVQHVPAAPSGEMAPRKLAESDLGDLELDPLRAQIHGSKDHQRVAQALFRAGQALMDRGEQLRVRGEIDRGRELAERGKRRLERATEELKPLLEQEEPPFVSLFYLGRCRELLFRHSERYEGLSLTDSTREYQQREQKVREPFLAISARDIEKDGARGEVAVLGSWGQAAKTAMEHFRWMNLHSSYDASKAIEELTWPGEGDR